MNTPTGRCVFHWIDGQGDQHASNLFTATKNGGKPRIDIKRQCRLLYLSFSLQRWKYLTRYIMKFIGATVSRQDAGFQLTDIEHVVAHRVQVVGSILGNSHKSCLFVVDLPQHALANPRDAFFYHRQWRAKFARSITDKVMGCALKLPELFILSSQQRFVGSNKPEQTLVF